MLRVPGKRVPRASGEGCGLLGLCLRGAHLEGEGRKWGALDPAETSRGLWNQARRRRRTGDGRVRDTACPSPEPLNSASRTRDHSRGGVGGGSPSSRSIARSVSSLPPLCPSSPQFQSLRPPPPPSACSNRDSSCEAPAPPPFSSLSHWLKLQGRVPRAGGSHWWDEQSEFPDEGTFCSIKGAGKAGDSAV